MNLSEAANVIMRLHGSGLSLVLTSIPGMGKTSITRQSGEALARHLGIAFHDTRDPEPEGDAPLFLYHHRIAGTYESPDVRGFCFPNRDANNVLVTGFSWPDIFPNPTLLARAGGVMIVVDELGQASHDVQKALANILLERAIGDFKLENYVPEGCGVSLVAASNRTSDRSGVVRELAFLTNRVGYFDISFSIQGLQNWMNSRGVHPMGVAFVGKNPGVFVDHVPNEPGPFCTPRSLVNMLTAVQALQDGGDRNRLVLDGIAVQVAAGFVGEGVAAQFASFVKLADQLPDQEDIEKEPTKTKLPEKLDAQYVVSVYVARWLAERVKGEKSTKKAEALVKAYLTYGGRMPQDLQVMIVKTASTAWPGVVNTNAFREWAIANKSVIVAAHA